MNDDDGSSPAVPSVPEPGLSAARDELLRQIQADYSTTIRRVEFPNLTMEILKAADPDRILEEAVRSEEASPDGTTAWQPYWAEAWDSAIALGSWLIREGLPSSSSKPATVLDLGCGLGVAGAVAAHLGCLVTLGDNAPPSLPFAEWNVWPWKTRAHVRHLDWYQDQLEYQGFDVILGADILYERESWPAQNNFCQYHLRTGGTLLFAEPNRLLSNDFAKTFEANGWLVECWMYHPPEVPKALRMFRCQRADEC